MIENEQERLEALCDIIELVGITQVVVFCASDRDVECLEDQISRRGSTVSTLCEAMTTVENETTLHEFRTGMCRVLIITDTWGRHNDQCQWSLLVHFDPPRTNTE